MNRHLLILLVVILTYSSTADGLKCIQCTGLLGQCTSSLPAPTECPSPNEICAKAVGKRGGEEMVLRLCALEPDGSESSCKTDASGELCAHFCKTDGCNGSPTVFSPPSKWTTLSGIFLLILNGYTGWF